jgi:hypothetical protein
MTYLVKEQLYYYAGALFHLKGEAYVKEII